MSVETLTKVSTVDLWRLPDNSAGLDEAEVTFWADADTDQVLGVNPTIKWFTTRHWGLRTEITLGGNQETDVFIETGLAAHYKLWDDVELCDHGLSAWLCADPINHYPPDH